MSEKSRKNQGSILTKLIIPQLLIVLEYQSSARLMGGYEKNLICIFMHFNENIRNE